MDERNADKLRDENPGGRDDLIEQVSELEQAVSGLTQEMEKMDLDGRQVVANLESERDRERALKNELQDSAITWGACPNCRGLVAFTGVPCVVGFCDKCQAPLIESELETVDPVAVVAGLRAALEEIAKETGTPYARVAMAALEGLGPEDMERDL